VTATEWYNFFALRCHPDADPTMRALAEAMRDAINGSKCSPLGDHLPYITDTDVAFAHGDIGGENAYDLLAKISAARCARVSYLNHDGSDADIAKDLALADHLLQSKHMSPFEHQATADTHTHHWGWAAPQLHGNLKGWKQYRKTIE
jgi:thymidylate synthase ThyX